MVDKGIMIVAAVFNPLAASRSSGNIHCSYQHYEPDKITLEVSGLMTVYLVATLYELRMIKYVLYFWL